jgi:hypothetical protein
MKRITALLLAGTLSVACGSHKSDIETISTFYEAVLGLSTMSDGLLKETLSQDLLSSIWEADYADTYSYWAFRTGFQDGPSRDSELEGIEPLGEGWYRVSYSDMGTPGVTDVKLENGRITDYRPFRVPYTLARNYYRRTDNIEDVLPLKITSEEELLRYFGYAAVMGRNGEPTKIDFEESFVIPIMLPQTDRETEIIIKGLYHSRPGSLTLAFETVSGEQALGYTMLPFELLIVDAAYRDCRIEF